MTKPLALEVNHWYAWEMLPGYSSGRYYSPIRINHIQPLDTGRKILRLNFYNACYAEGVRDFNVELQILFRGENYILANLQDGAGKSSDRCAIIEKITTTWLLSHFAGIANHPLMSCTDREERLREIIEDFFDF